MSILAAVMQGVGKGVSTYGNAMMNAEIDKDKQAAIMGMRDQINQKNYQQQRQDKLSDYQMQRRDSQADYQQKRQDAQSDFKDRLAEQHSYDDPKTQMVYGQDGSAYLVDKNTGQSTPVTKQLSPSEIEAKQSQQDSALKSSVNSGAGKPGIIGKYMSLDGSNGGIDQQGWTDVKSPKVSETEQLKIADPRGSRVKTYQMKDGSIVDTNGTVLVPGTASLSDLNTLAASYQKAIESTYNDEQKKQLQSILDRINQKRNHLAGIGANNQVGSQNNNDPLGLGL